MPRTSCRGGEKRSGRRQDAATARREAPRGLSVSRAHARGAARARAQTDWLRLSVRRPLRFEKSEGQPPPRRGPPPRLGRVRAARPIPRACNSPVFITRHRNQNEDRHATATFSPAQHRASRVAAARALHPHHRDNAGAHRSYSGANRAAGSAAASRAQLWQSGLPPRWNVPETGCLRVAMGLM